MFDQALINSTHKNCLHIYIWSSEVQRYSQLKKWEIILNLRISTLSQTSSPLIFLPLTQPFLTRNLKQASNCYQEILPSQKWKSEIQIFSFRSRGTLFVKEHSDSKSKYTEEDIIKMLEFLVDNIFVVSAEKVFQQIVDIPMGTNCASMLTDIFLYSYEAEFIQSLLSVGKKRLASRFNFTYKYIDDVLSINNPDFENYLGQMSPPP